MDLLSNLAMGFSVASSIANLFFCLIGVILGTLVNALLAGTPAERIKDRMAQLEARRKDPEPSLSVALPPSRSASIP